MKAFLKKRYSGLLSVTVMNTVREERFISAYRLQFNTVGSQGKTLLTGLLPATSVQLAFLYNPGPPPRSKDDSAHSRRLSPPSITAVHSLKLKCPFSVCKGDSWDQLEGKTRTECRQFLILKGWGKRLNNKAFFCFQAASTMWQAVSKSPCDASPVMIAFNYLPACLCLSILICEPK